MNASLQIQRQVEEASLNAWPALNVVIFDGWILRFAGGYTKRANSVSGFYDSVLPVPEKIKRCEDFYLEKGLRPIFRLTPFIQPANLDDLLCKRGYQHLDLTNVQLLDLRTFPLPISDQVTLLEGDDRLASWLHSFHKLNPGRGDIQTHEQILRNVSGKICLMLHMIGEEVVTCGLAILSGIFLGLFDIVTADSQRGKGYGKTLTQSLLAWGKSRGAQYAYLQVMAENSPARKLYAGLGFEDIYTYWYRAAPGAAAFDASSPSQGKDPQG